MRKKDARNTPAGALRLTFRKPERPQRSAEAGAAQPALAGLPQGLAAEARPAAVQAAGTTGPSQFAAAGSRREERRALLTVALRPVLRVSFSGIVFAAVMAIATSF